MHKITYLVPLGMLGIAYCAYTDTKTGLIYNKVLFPLIFLSLLGIFLFYPSEFLPSLKWGLIAWGIFIPMILIGFLGGGDGKLFALVGILFQEKVIAIILLFLLITLVWFVFCELREGVSIKTLFTNLLLFGNFANKGKHYSLGGLFILLASIIAFLKEWIF